MSLPQFRQDHQTPSFISRARQSVLRYFSSNRRRANKRSDDDDDDAGGAYGRSTLVTRLKSGLNLPLLCILVWIVALLWGERWVFENSLAACEWKNWERWPKAASPHHMVLLADPQIVDPHTYIGRPWPLSKFTEMHTDNYMRRSFIQLQKHIRPDTAIFLGDMFDGGREWMAKGASTADPLFVPIRRPDRESKYALYWKKTFGDAFWLKEYFRFSNMFFAHWNDFGSYASPGQRGRKLITGLPGNHDFGFGANVRQNARNRFQTYFGESNRVDIIGNHSVVSIDSLSLSARGIDLPETKEITKPVEDFLDQVQGTKRRAIARELRYLAGEPEYFKNSHVVYDADAPATALVQSFDGGDSIAEFPSILLTHVPLYRDPGAACGPLREKMPPASPPVKPDIPNGIPISQGYQYQNVLSPTDSLDILQKVGDVVHVFSGDDHDYCELMHIQARGGVKEITVKTMSWSMGIRKPAVLLVSLWNPVDASGQSIGTHMSGHGAHLDRKTGQPLTIETHLCHLPDQIGIFIRYLVLLSITLIVLIARAIFVPIYGLSPFSSSTTRVPQKTIKHPSNGSSDEASTIPYSTFSDAHSLVTRSTGTRNRSGSVTPSTYSYGLTTSQSKPPHSTPTNGYHKHEDDYELIEAGYSTHTTKGRERSLTKAELSWREAWMSIRRVTWAVLAWYLWLVWTG